MRNFVNLENISRAIASITEHFPDNYECYNLASSQADTMTEVANKVKVVYERMYNKPLQLNITGTEPASTNFFEISLDKLKNSGFTEDNNYTLESEIEQIFYYLQSK